MWDRKASASLSASGGHTGAVVGSMLVAAWSDTRKRLAAHDVSAWWPSGRCSSASRLSPWFLLGLPLVFAANIFASIYGTLNNTAIQLLIPDEVRGRISSFLMMSFSLPMLGTLPMAAIAERWGAPYAVAFASVAAVTVALLFYAWSPSLRSMDESVKKAMAEGDGGPRLPLPGPR